MIEKEDSSFRDSDGFVFYHNNQVYRAINNCYKSIWDKANESGFLSNLKDKGYLITHEEVNLPEVNLPNSVFSIIKPIKLPFISYPYEWSFSEWKAAALLTLKIQEESLQHNFSLKDATAYNVQFVGPKPIFIDSTSFDIYKENEPWVAYGQFCRHFLGPLLLFKYKRAELSKLSQAYIDGIPLSVISKALPLKSKFNFFIYSHIHLHSKYERKFSQATSIQQSKLRFSKSRLLALLTHLKEGIQNLKDNESSTEWTDYYATFSYDKNSFDQKKRVVAEFIDTINPKKLIDLGCNEGEFSMLASGKVDQVVAVDFNERVVNRLYKKCRKVRIENILPLVYDLMNPSPGIGWANEERTVFFKRNKFDCALALALIHHIAIGNNVPLDRIAKYFSQIAPNLIIEFVPKDDPQTQRLLITKKDIFESYTENNFKAEFKKYYTFLNEVAIEGSNRKLFLLKRND